MVNFFKITDPLRIVFLLVILLVLRVPFMFSGLPLTIPELEWMLVGEKLSGDYMMYSDLWALYAPFAAGTYSIIVSLAGKSSFILAVISLIMVFLQALFINFIFSNNNLYNERTTIPALLYIIFSCLFFDFYTLPPVLLALNFLLPGLYILIIQLRYRTTNEGMLHLGILTGLATLFYFPSCLFLLTFIFSLIFFTAATFRKHILMLTGFMLPLLLTSLYYFYFDSLDDLMQNFLYSYFSVPAVQYSEIKLVGLIAIIPVSLLLLGLAAISGRSAYINYQYNVLKVMLLWLIVALLSLFFTMHFGPYQLYIFLPVLAYFGTHFFLLVKSRLVTELALWTVLIFVPLINAGFTYGFLQKKGSNVLENLVVKTPDNLPSVNTANKKILVLGNRIEYYQNSKLATPYFNWDLSKKHFNNLNNLGVLSDVYKNFKRDMPEVILDQKKVMGQVFERIPALEKEYFKLENEDVYVLKSND